MKKATDPRHQKRRRATKALVSWSFNEQKIENQIAKRVIKRVKEIDKIIKELNFIMNHEFNHILRNATKISGRILPHKTDPTYKEEQERLNVAMDGIINNETYDTGELGDERIGSKDMDGDGIAGHEMIENGWLLKPIKDAKKKFYSIEEMYGKDDKVDEKFEDKWYEKRVYDWMKERKKRYEKNMKKLGKQQQKQGKGKQGKGKQGPSEKWKPKVGDPFVGGDGIYGKVTSIDKDGNVEWEEITEQEAKRIAPGKLNGAVKSIIVKTQYRPDIPKLEIPGL